MKLKFLGRGAAFNIKEGNTSAYFIEDEKLFLVDCGESVFKELVNRDILSQIKEIYVLISHTHSDHCGSLGSLGLYCQFVLQNKLKIIVPHDEDYIQSLKNLMILFGNTEKAYEFIYDDELDNFFNSFLSVRYELTKHDYMLVCYSFVFETVDGGIFYSADTRTSENLLRFIDTHKYIDCIYMEATDLKVVNDIHMNIEVLDAVVPGELKNKMWMMHLRGEECKTLIKKAGFNVVSC